MVGCEMTQVTDPQVNDDPPTRDDAKFVGLTPVQARRAQREGTAARWLYGPRNRRLDFKHIGRFEE